MRTTLHEDIPIGNISIDLSLKRDILDFEYSADVKVTFSNGDEMDFKRDSGFFNFIAPRDVPKEEYQAYIEYRLVQEYNLLVTDIFYKIWRRVRTII